MSTELVLMNDEAAIQGIRNSGAQNLILAPGNDYTGGHSWVQNIQQNVASASYIYKVSSVNQAI